MHDAGDHVIVVGEVEDVRCAEATPLRVLRGRLPPPGVGLVMERIQLVVYSDYLAPLVYLAEHRLGLLQREPATRSRSSGGASCCPRARAGRDLEKFVRYTQSWLRPAGEPMRPCSASGRARRAATHSVPAHLVAEAAAALGPRLSPRFTRACCAPTSSRAATSAPSTRCARSGRGRPPRGGLRALPRTRAARPGGRSSQHQRSGLRFGITGVPASSRGRHRRLRARARAARHATGAGSSACARGGSGVLDRKRPEDRFSELDGRVAVVTGASSGMGVTFARRARAGRRASWWGPRGASRSMREVVARDRAARAGRRTPSPAT